MRKDTLQRHTDNKHTRKEPKYRHVTEDISGLSRFGFSTSKQSVKDAEENIPLEPVEDPARDSDEVLNSSADTNDNFLERDDPEVSHKRSHEAEGNDTNTKRMKKDYNDNVDEKLDEFGKKLMAQFDSRLEKVLVSLSSSKQSASSSGESSNLDKVEKSDEDLNNLIHNCKDIESLEHAIKVEDIEIIKEEDVKPGLDGYYCNLCCQGTKPNFETQSNGVFTVDKVEAKKAKDKNQSRAFLNLKGHISNHLTANKFHKQKKIEIKSKNFKIKELQSRQEKIGLRLFRMRYQGIKHGKSRADFEEEVLKAHLNGEDVGDLNHSRFFAKDLDKAIYKSMKKSLKFNVNLNLDSTKQKQPAGLVMDKMTPNKRTGQIHGVIIPVPENPLSQNLLVPLMLEVPPVKQHDAEGLAKSAKEVFTSAGFSDDQLEGVGWDGEYVHKGVKKKLIDLLDVPGMHFDEMIEWITEVWEPAHQLELTTKDARKMDIFQWLEDHIKIINDVTFTLNIGKGLEQSLKAAEEVNEKFFKLKPLSDTRFSAYFEKSIDNFEKRLNTTIEALRKRVDSKDKDVKETAIRLLKKVCTKEFLILNLGLLDIYRLLGSVSSQLQTVQMFPWDIPKKQRELICLLRKMEKLKLTINDETDEMEEINQQLWENLGEKLDFVLDEKYVSAATTLSAGRRTGRSSADISASSSLLSTVENKLSSLCSHLAKHLERRIEKNPTPKVIELMGKCLDLGELLKKDVDKDDEKKREESLKSIAKIDKYSENDVEEIMKQYKLFIQRFRGLVESDGENKDIINRFEHILFETHQCCKSCEKKCLKAGKVLDPREPNLFKLFHLFLKEPNFYNGLHDFLHFFLRCLMKTHAEGVAESMGNIMEINGDKRRGRMEIDDIGDESMIHWNGPPLHLADSLGMEALDIHFGGRAKWNFVTLGNKSESVVIKRLKKVESKVPFF